jgi:hypothetical protein
VCNLRNKVRTTNRKTSEELFANTPFLASTNLDNFHPFGCPVYVLDSVLQGTVSKLPHWSPRSRVGVYLGHSPHHAGSEVIVLHLQTGHVSPQYHLVFEDDFCTVENLRLGTVPTNWDELNRYQRESATEENYRLANAWTYPYEDPKTPSMDWLVLSLENTRNEGDIMQNEGYLMQSEGTQHHQEDFSSNEGEQQDFIHTVDSNSHLVMQTPINLEEAG